MKNRVIERAYDFKVHRKNSSSFIKELRIYFKFVQISIIILIISMFFYFLDSNYVDIES